MRGRVERGREGGRGKDVGGGEEGGRGGEGRRRKEGACVGACVRACYLDGHGPIGRAAVEGAHAAHVLVDADP